DDAGNAELARGLDSGGTGRYGPMGMDHIRLTLARLSQDGPILGSQIAGHHPQPSEFPQPRHLALGHPAVGQVRRKIERKTNDLYSIEHVLPRQGRTSRRHHGHRVSPAYQVAVDVVNVSGLSVAGVLWVPIGG